MSKNTHLDPVINCKWAAVRNMQGVFCLKYLLFRNQKYSGSRSGKYLVSSSHKYSGSLQSEILSEQCSRRSRKSLGTWELVGGILWPFQPWLLPLFRLGWARGQVQGIASITSGQNKFSKHHRFHSESLFPVLHRLAAINMYFNWAAFRPYWESWVKGLSLKRLTLWMFGRFSSICNFLRAEIFSVSRGNKSKPFLKIFLIISNFGSRGR